MTAATKLLVLRSHTAPCVLYRTELWRTATNGANMATAVLTRPATLTRGIHRQASHTAFFEDRSVVQDVMLADIDLLPADDCCHIAHARNYVHQATATHTRRCIHMHLTRSCRLCMHRITWSLLFGIVWPPGTEQREYSMRRSCCSTSTPLLHRNALREEWLVTSQTPQEKTSRVEPACRHSHAGACDSRHTGCMVRFAQRRCKNVTGELRTFTTPRHGNTFGTMQPGQRNTNETLAIVDPIMSL